MAKSETLTQCKMDHSVDGRVGMDVAWIQTKLAKKGTLIKFRDLPGTFRVTEVWGTLPKEEVELRERSFKHQRSQSDVERDPNRGKE